MLGNKKSEVNLITPDNIKTQLVYHIGAVMAPIFNDDFGGNPPTLVGGWITHT